MATDLDGFSTRTVVGLVVAASLGAAYVFGYSPLGRLLVSDGTGGETGARTGSDPERARARTTRTRKATATKADVDGTPVKEGEEGGVLGVGRKGRRKRKGKSQDEDEGTAECRTKGGDVGAGALPVSSQVVPGDFDGGSPGDRPEETSKQPTNPRSPKKKKKTKKQIQNDKERDGPDAASDQDPGLGREADMERLNVHGPRSGESIDDLVSLSRSVSSDASPSLARATGHEAWPFRPPGLASDIDSSWTDVDHSHLKASTSIKGQERAADNVAPTASDAQDEDFTELDRILMRLRQSPPRGSPVPRRGQRNKLNPREPQDLRALIELSNDPAPARVMRVQPRADETPVPGFSWEDYGDVVEDSVAHDADEEDEGEWDVVKGRHRTRPQPAAPATAASASTVASHPPAAPESMTKKQRQNARKRELAKATKAEAEAARLQGLARHQRELERLRIIEQSRQGGGKRPGGGMQATVDEHGKLVWE